MARSLNMTAEESRSVAVRGHLSRAGVMSEAKMFGGTGFMLNRNLVAAASKRGLLLRVRKDRYRDALAWPGARPMEMRGPRDGRRCLYRPACADE
jgi:hypothetical protein